MRVVFILLVVTGGCSFFDKVDADHTVLLTIPSQDKTNATKRKVAIKAVANSISNKPRFQVVKGVTYPMPPGPIGVKGSLAEQIITKELQLSDNNGNPHVDAIFIEAITANIATFGDYLSFYRHLANLQLIPTPLTALNFSDVAFGEDRLTIKGFRLRQVTKIVKAGTIPLSAAQLNRLCGANSLGDLIQQKRFYVEDLSFASTYNDPSRPYKYVPSVKGYFCVNQKKQFVPIAIYILDTKLVYTPFDNANEWKLAKMALNAASLNVQPMDHFIVCHIMLEPIRVELLRAMSSRHPIYVLMEHHFLQLFGNTILGLNVLLSANTTLDFTFGWGASGSLRFLYDESRKFDFSKQFFVNQVQPNGFDGIPNAKLFADSRNIFKAIQEFVRDFVTIYYSHGGPSGEADSAIAADSELQNWFAASSKIVPGFPSKATTVNALVDTLSNLIFRTSVQHHAMNSDVLWNTLSFPYSLPSLFAPLPTKKGQAFDLTNFVIPQTLFAPLTAQSSAFLRPIRPAITILHSYETLAFNITASRAIIKYKARLQGIESDIAAREKSNPRPYTFLKPSRLPHYVWI